MEEQQIQDFVQRVAGEKGLRRDLQEDAQAVVGRQGFTPRVERIILRLVPHLAFGGLPPVHVNRWWD